MILLELKDAYYDVFEKMVVNLKHLVLYYDEQHSYEMDYQLKSCGRKLYGKLDNWYEAVPRLENILAAENPGMPFESRLEKVDLNFANTALRLDDWFEVSRLFEAGMRRM